MASVFLLLVLLGGGRLAMASDLPVVNGASFDGSTITWDALDNAVGYNVYRNARYEATVVGTAFVPGQAGEYQIVAFDGNGSLSLKEATEAAAEAAAGPLASVVVTEVFDASLPLPQNVVGIVYSNTSGEIFWDRVSAQDLEYTVISNGIELGTTDGTSFLLDSLLSNTENRVSVTARSEDGSVSAPVVLLFDTSATVFPASATETALAAPLQRSHLPHDEGREAQA